MSCCLVEKCEWKLENESFPSCHKYRTWAIRNDLEATAKPFPSLVLPGDKTTGEAKFEWIGRD